MIVDLMDGVANQTPAGILADIKLLNALSEPYISLFSLISVPSSSRPLRSRHQIMTSRRLTYWEIQHSLKSTGGATRASFDSLICDGDLAAADSAQIDACGQVSSHPSSGLYTYISRCAGGTGRFTVVAFRTTGNLVSRR